MKHSTSITTKVAPAKLQIGATELMASFFCVLIARVGVLAMTSGAATVAAGKSQI